MRNPNPVITTKVPATTAATAQRRRSPRRSSAATPWFNAMATISADNAMVNASSVRETKMTSIHTISAAPAIVSKVRIET